MTSPRSLFKFCTLSAYSLGSLTNGTLWLAKPKEFNDPFDCAITLDRMRYKESILHTISVVMERAKATGLKREHLADTWPGDKDAFEAFRSKILELTQEMGVCCFSARATHMLMWSHYANHHKGLCVEYDSSPGTDLGNLAHAVRYSNAWPSLSVADFAPSKSGSALDTMWLTKAKCWQYEREWRVMMPQGNRSYKAPSPIKAVIFGSRMPEADRVLVAQALRHETNVIFKEATMVEGKFLVKISRI